MLLLILPWSLTLTSKDWLVRCSQITRCWGQLCRMDWRKAAGPILQHSDVPASLRLSEQAAPGRDEAAFPAGSTGPAAAPSLGLNSSYTELSWRVNPTWNQLHNVYSVLILFIKSNEPKFKRGGKKKPTHNRCLHCSFWKENTIDPYLPRSGGNDYRLSSGMAHILIDPEVFYTQPCSGWQLGISLGCFPDGMNSIFDLYCKGKKQIFKLSVCFSGFFCLILVK